MRTKASVFRGTTRRQACIPHTNAEPDFREWTLLRARADHRGRRHRQSRAATTRCSRDSWMVIDHNAVDRDVTRCAAAEDLRRSARRRVDHARRGSVTRARRPARVRDVGGRRRSRLDDEWLDRADPHNRKPGDEFEIRAQERGVRAERRAHARRGADPATTCAARCSSSTRVYDGLDPGRGWSSAVNAPTSDATPGVLAAEPARVAAVAQVPTLQAAPLSG